MQCDVTQWETAGARLQLIINVNFSDYLDSSYAETLQMQHSIQCLVRDNN